jgi:hypothetical protein
MRTTAGTPSIIYWCVALIKYRNTKREKIKSVMRKKGRMFVNMQHCWKHYITHPHCQRVFPVSAFYFDTKNTSGTLKLLNFV